MSAACYPIDRLPHTSQLFRDYLTMEQHPNLRAWYGADPSGFKWTSRGGNSVDRAALADALEAQCVLFDSGPAALANVAKLRQGARAVVTGQQVGLFGGPLLTLLKAATAIARADEATRATGVDHVPVFWLATEDHDLAEANRVNLLTKTAVEAVSVRVGDHGAAAVGGILLGAEIEAALDRASELLGHAPICERLRTFYTPETSFGAAFARLMAWLFRSHGLIVMDASGRAFHALGTTVLRAAIERAGELEQALLARTEELQQAGYPAQVLVKPGASLLFLIDEETGARQALRRPADDVWRAGANSYTTRQLLAIVEAEPERLSPNALLRPVMQDAILPTAAYIGGPAEIAYFAQSSVLYERIWGRTTPVLPRLTATLIEATLAARMRGYELTLPDVFTTAEALAQRLAARAMPIATKRQLAALGNAMDAEAAALGAYLGGIDASLQRAAEVSTSKMLYQMNRLRRMAAAHELQKQASLRKHAEALTVALYPDGHLQERVVGGVWFLAKMGEGLIDRLVQEAHATCPGHMVIEL